MRSLRLVSCLYFLVYLITSSCYAESKDNVINGNAGSKFLAKSFGTFNEPWAMTFLPTGELLVTEKNGTLLLVDPEQGSRQEVQGVPRVAYGGQGGLGDVILHPQYAQNNWIYLSYAQQGASGKRGPLLCEHASAPRPLTRHWKTLKLSGARHPRLEEADITPTVLPSARMDISS